MGCKAVLIAVVTLGACASASSAQDFTIASWGGNYQEAQREAYFKPFASANGLNLAETTYLGGLAELQTMADTGKTVWDAVMMGSADLMLACDEGLLEEFDWSTVGNADKIPDEVKYECGVGNVVVATGIAYNSDGVNEPPKTADDFFNIEKWPGKRGIYNKPNSMLELALIADGVEPDKVYEVLATEEGVDRAFAKLDTIKAHAQFWSAGAQPVEWLVAGNVVMSTAFNGRIATARSEGKPLAFIWDHASLAIDGWAIPKGTPNRVAAFKFIDFVNAPESQAKFSDLYPYGPTNPEAESHITSKNVDTMPVGANIENAYYSNNAFWVEHLDALTERWNKWSAR
ncbi:ABC transporter substrate-binding protein [Brucella anthropi]|uniref:ABC transporter substrate-binding protein n=1 Tax=Brucella anthropi TaxID=529 RepID=UPI001AED8FC8|nr:ABC transporter substrate-binding protein [Brucella anthropi]